MVVTPNYTLKIERKAQAESGASSREHAILLEDVEQALNELAQIKSKFAEHEAQDIEAVLDGILSQSIYTTPKLLGEKNQNEQDEEEEVVNVFLMPRSQKELEELIEQYGDKLAELSDKIAPVRNRQVVEEYEKVLFTLRTLEKSLNLQQKLVQEAQNVAHQTERLARAGKLSERLGLQLESNRQQQGRITREYSEKQTRLSYMKEQGEPLESIKTVERELVSLRQQIQQTQTRSSHLQQRLDVVRQQIELATMSQNVAIKSQRVLQLQVMSQRLGQQLQQSQQQQSRVSEQMKQQQHVMKQLQATKAGPERQQQMQQVQKQIQMLQQQQRQVETRQQQLQQRQSVVMQSQRIAEQSQRVAQTAERVARTQTTMQRVQQQLQQSQQQQSRVSEQMKQQQHVMKQLQATKAGPERQQQMQQVQKQIQMLQQQQRQVETRQQQLQQRQSVVMQSQRAEVKMLSKMASRQVDAQLQEQVRAAKEALPKQSIMNRVLRRPVAVADKANHFAKENVLKQGDLQSVMAKQNMLHMPVSSERLPRENSTRISGDMIKNPVANDRDVRNETVAKQYEAPLEGGQKNVIQPQVIKEQREKVELQQVASKGGLQEADLSNGAKPLKRELVKEVTDRKVNNIENIPFEEGRKATKPVVENELAAEAKHEIKEETLKVSQQTEATDFFKRPAPSTEIEGGACANCTSRNCGECGSSPKQETQQKVEVDAAGKQEASVKPAVFQRQTQQTEATDFFKRPAPSTEIEGGACANCTSRNCGECGSSPKQDAQQKVGVDPVEQGTVAKPNIFKRSVKQAEKPELFKRSQAKSEVVELNSAKQVENAKAQSQGRAA